MIALERLSQQSDLCCCVPLSRVFRKPIAEICAERERHKPCCCMQHSRSPQQHTHTTGITDRVPHYDAIFSVAATHASGRPDNKALSRSNHTVQGRFGQQALNEGC